MARPTPNNPTGAQRKPKQEDPAVIQKLEQAFAVDASVDEACFFAGISPTTYYEILTNQPKLAQRFEGLRNQPVLKAKVAVVSKLGESYQNAMDYLSRKRKEYSAKTSMEMEGDVTFKVILNGNNPALQPGSDNKALPSGGASGQAKE